MPITAPRPASRQVGAVPLDDPGDHEPRRRAEHEQQRLRRASRCSETRRVRRPGETIDQPRRRPAAPADEDARELEHAVRRHELDEADAVPGLSHQPADHPEQQAVVEEGERGGDPARDPARERHERDLDVVREDLAS